MRLPVIIPVVLNGGLIEAFGAFAGLKGAFLLDSGSNLSKDSRYSFAGLNPIHSFSASGGFVTIDGHTVIDNPLSSLKKLVSLATGINCMEPYLPFAGGLVGFISFEWGNGLGALSGGANVPDLFFNLYDTIVTYDHLEETAWVSSLGLEDDGSFDNDLAKARAESLVSMLTPQGRGAERRGILSHPPLTGRHPLVPSLTKDGFINGVNILKGTKTLPVFAQQFSSPTHKTPWQVYLDIRSENQAAFAAYLSCEDFHVLSASRTCLIKISGDRVHMRPTKGCRSRSKDGDENTKRINELKYDEEIQLSHRYLVADLVRSLSGVCDAVETEKIACVESDARAHHLVSVVSGEKEAAASPLDCLLAVLPASTGNSAGLVSKLEGVPRNVYTGTIGFIGCNGVAEFNSAFRTMILKDTIGYLHAGSEISMNSDPEETFVNVVGSARHIFELCQTRSI